MENHSNNQNWILLPGGVKAIYRRPSETMIPDSRLATMEELLLANQGFEFPWGKSPSADKASKLWKEQRIGMGGLIFDRWFKTADGRFGGAPNVPLTVPATLRYSLLIGGGLTPDEELEDNEGFAIIKEMNCGLCVENQTMRRKVQIYASEHVAADGGSIIVSPIGKIIQSTLDLLEDASFAPMQNLYPSRLYKMPYRNITSSSFLNGKNGPFSDSIHAF